MVDDRMSIVQATASLYRTAFMHMLRGLPRTLLALGVLLLGAIALTAVDELFFRPLGPGMLSSLGRALLADVFVGTYLSLIGLWVLAGRAVLARHLRLHAANLFIPLLTVVFYFWIARMILGLMTVPYGWVLLVVAGIAVNPVPEVLYQDRSSGPAALGDAFQFISRNWPEWLVAQLPWLAFLVGWAVLYNGEPTPQVLARLWLECGPELQPVVIPSRMLWPVDSPVFPYRATGAVVLLAVFHAYMLFRGALYRELSKGNRRLRAWQSRM